MALAISGDLGFGLAPGQYMDLRPEKGSAAAFVLCFGSGSVLGVVPCNVRREFGLPELRARCGSGRVPASLMPMPEAAVHKDDGAILRQNEVRSAVDLLRMKPEAETARVQCPPESQLGLGVVSPDPRHHPGTGLLVYDIGHIRPGFRP